MNITRWIQRRQAARRVRMKELEDVLRDLFTELTEGEACEMLAEFPIARFSTFDAIIDRARTVLNISVGSAARIE